MDLTGVPQLDPGLRRGTEAREAGRTSVLTKERSARDHPSRAAPGPQCISSTAIATASPPPMHSEPTPRLAPRFSSAASSVARMRAPDAPIG